MHYSGIYKNRYKLVLPARASFWYTASLVAERGIGFIFTPIFTRLLTPAEYGLYSLYVSFMGIFTVFITLELAGNIIYRGISKFSGREGEFMRACLGVISLCALLFGVALAVFGRGMSAITGLSVQLLTFLAIQVYLNGIVNLYTARQRYYYRYRSAILPNLLISILSPLLAFVITRFFGAGAPARIYAYLVVSAVVALPLAASIMRGGILFSRDVLLFVIRSAFPLLPHFVAASISVQAGRAIVGIFRGEGELAVYSVVFSMATVLSLMSGGISSSLSPWISRKLSLGGAHNTEKLRNVHFVVKALVLPFCLAVLMFLCFSREALLILAPPEYQVALGALFPLAVAVILSFIQTVQAAVILYYDGTVAISSATVVSALLTLALNLLLVPTYSYMATAYIQLGCAFLSVLLGALAIRLRTGARLSYSGYIIPVVFTASASAVIYAIGISLVARVILAFALLLLLIAKISPLKKLILDK